MFLEEGVCYDQIKHTKIFQIDLRFTERSENLKACIFITFDYMGERSACNTGDLGPIPRSGRSPGERNGIPLQYSYLENPMEGGAW